MHRSQTFRYVYAVPGYGERLYNADQYVNSDRSDGEPYSVAERHQYTCGFQRMWQRQQHRSTCEYEQMSGRQCAFGVCVFANLSSTFFAGCP